MDGVLEFEPLASKVGRVLDFPSAGAPLRTIQHGMIMKIRFINEQAKERCVPERVGRIFTPTIA